MAFAGGSGTSGDPYQVATAAQLNEVRDYLDKYFIQTADIDLSGYARWSPIGYTAHPFIGNYDGHHYEITNLTIPDDVGSSVNVGLFGLVSNATLQNIIIVDCNISGTNSENVAGLIGSVTQTTGTEVTTISQCSVSGSVSNTVYEYIGGLVGSVRGTAGTEVTNITECCVKLTLLRAYGSACQVAPVVAFVSSAVLNITDTYAVTTAISVVKPNSDFGSAGFLGTRVNGVCTITNCYSVCYYQNDADSKGFCDASAIGVDPVVISCYWDITVSTPKTSYAGTTARTTAEMVYPTYDEYTDWDFTTVWRHDKLGTYNDFYPILRWQYVIPEWLVNRKFKVLLSLNFYKWEKNKYFDACKCKAYVISEEIAEDE